MEGTHQYWMHTPSGEVYAVAISDNGTVVQACGPLHHSDVRAALIASFAYNDEPDLAEWINQHQEEFVLFDGAGQPAALWND